MPRNLWIGHPGRLREITQAATGWERGADLGVGQFTALGGQVTTHAPRRSARKLKLTFDRLPEADATHLDRLARRVDGPGPLAVLDPVTRNLLDPLQAAGRGDGAASAHWRVVSGSGTVVRDTGAGALPDTWSWRPAADSDRLAWTARHWPGFPVPPGASVRFTVPTAWRVTTSKTQLDWKDAAGEPLVTTSASRQSVVGTAPAGAAFVTPSASVAVDGNRIGLAGAVLTLDDPHVPASPQDLLADDQAAGKGDLARWQADKATLSADSGGYAVLDIPANVDAVLRWKNGGTAGFPVAPGQAVDLTVSSVLRGRASACFLTWYDRAGAFVGVVDAWAPGTAPAKAAFVEPALQFTANANAFNGRIGASKLRSMAPDGELPGDGCPPMAITAYTDTPGRPLPYRGLSLDLTEVTSAAG
ncbi:hypothetical protein AB0I84_08690 [Streptomyces spectabilis]|uniref:hypothetical protein n=1 Tax=Streptomyces spectabilis TaxID=68270 RepID=UPI003401F703